MPRGFSPVSPHRWVTGAISEALNLKARDPFAANVNYGANSC